MRPLCGWTCREKHSSRTGKRTISICITGHDKVILAAMADGRKLKSYVVFKGVQPVAALMEIQGVVVAFNRSGWMNEALIMDWVTRVWGTLNFQWCILMWDAYRCHLMSSHVKKSTNSNISVIPVGLTSHFSLPMFLETNHSKRRTRHSTIIERMVSGDKSYTPAGNMCAPDKILCSWWVKKAWMSVTPEGIKKSFLACGISVNTNGSQDSEVSCLKEGGIAGKASATIAEKADSGTLKILLQTWMMKMNWSRTNSLLRRTSIWAGHSDTCAHFLPKLT